MLHQLVTGTGRLIARWPFVTLGLVTAALFVAQEFFDALPPALLPAVRVLIIPLWLMRTVEMIVGIGYWPRALQFIVALPLLFLPYLLLDILLHRIRRALARPAVAV